MTISEPPPPESATTEPVDLSSTNPHSLHQAVHARRAEYVRPHRIRVKIGTWNVAACPGTDKDLASWFVDGKGLDVALGSLDVSNNPVVETDDAGAGRADGDNGIHLLGGDKVGLYVLGLQEIVDLNTVNQYMARVYSTDNGPMEKWQSALESALPEGYQLVTAEQLTGMLLLIYASPEVAASISNVSTVSVGTGLLGYLGNKGAVVTRIILGETTRMVFINSHLASGIEASYIERRIWDVGQILSRAQFEPVVFAGVSEDEGEKIGDEDFAFWFGDLNFRLDGLPGDDIRRLLMLHTRGEYDLAKKGLPREDSLEGEGVVVQKSPDSSEDEEAAPSRPTQADDDDSSIPLPDPDDFLPDPRDDPASLQATLDSLLPHDQLKRMIKERKVFHDGWHEGPITFLPSYKYDVGTVGLFDSSEKRRAPSWCDRILYRTRRDKEAHEKKMEEEEEARKKDQELEARGIDHAGDDDEVLFSYDPDNDGDDAPGSAGLEYDEYDEDEDNDLERVVTKEGFVDRIHLDIYTSHQRISSSDHKPIISIFTLDYDAVVPDLKAKVHAEVARQLDRAENEGRPGVTIVVDSNDAHASPDRQESSGIQVDLGEIRFLKRETATLTVANTGGVPATVAFVEKPTTEEPEEPGLPSWLITSFARPDTVGDDEAAVDLGKEVTLEPGETVNAVLEAFVGNIAQTRMLNDGQVALEEVLVLRVTDGRDHFIPVRGTWSPTCIGRSIDELIRVPDGGIKKFAQSLAQKKGRVGSISYDLDVRCAAPKELFKLTEAIETLVERALADEQMLDECTLPKEPGWPFEESTWTITDREVRDSRMVDLIANLDNDKALGDTFLPETTSIERLETASEVLLLFLRALTDGIITLPLWNRIEQASLASLGGAAPKQPPEDTSEDDKTAILDILATAPNHNIAFVFLTAMLAKVIAELSPLTKSELDVINSGNVARGAGMLGRRTLSFRRVGATPAAAALAALDRRKARERQYADIFGKVVCRAPAPEKDKDKKALEDKQRAAVELFLRRRGGGQ
ncbi:Endonuclease/exonuclease/phosphatase [Cercophora newfieldiana]|uniref:Endonuclease/exonuclease/phosphatase n=1 Tax=Cercophora newfieldiana TaxID=92897 RepID=A0AA39YIN6_9PEZI|nr:Endonuclease/exonuclease/phosphatase [Cercophora newfieldiana]